jgi:hypothetical protein
MTVPGSLLMISCGFSIQAPLVLQVLIMLLQVLTMLQVLIMLLQVLLV